MGTLQHSLKCLSLLPLQRSKVRQTFCWWCFPPHFFFFYSLFLLSQLLNISFDVFCWDFKTTLSTWAGVGFSEQARVPHSSRGASGSHTFLPGFFPGAARAALIPAQPPGPGPAEPPCGVAPAGVAGVQQDFLPVFLKPVQRDLSSFRAAEERLSNSRVLRFH